MSFFKKSQPKEFQLAANLYNKNIKVFSETQVPSSRKTMHQVLLTTIYNKVIFFHLNPQAQSVHIFELDPTFTYKNQHAIALPSPLSLYQMQISDNLLVLHDFTSKSS